MLAHLNSWVFFENKERRDPYDLRRYSNVDIRLFDISKMCVCTIEDDPSMGGSCMLVWVALMGGDAAANW